MKRSTKSLMVGWVAVVLAVSAWPARAAELKIWMDEFKANYTPLVGSNSTLIAYQSPASAGVMQNGNEKIAWQAWAPVNLPVGAFISKVVYYHGGSLGGGRITQCQLWRIRLGGTPENLGSVVSSSESPAIPQLQLTTSEDKLLIAKGYRYYVTVYADVSTAVRGVKITY